MNDLKSAQSDYQQLLQAYPKSFQIAYHLGEIAWRDRDTNQALQNYTIYLANAPTNSAEFNEIRQRVAGLTGKSP
jgi:TolA-binding protein